MQQTRRIKQIGLLLLLVMFVGIGIMQLEAGTVKANSPSSTKTLGRAFDPVVIPGKVVAFMNGTPVNQIFAYTYTNGSWGGQIPVQVDERSAAGTIVSFEDGLVDFNDEVIVMAKDTGDQAPSNASLPTDLQNSDFVYEVEVFDADNPSLRSWVYIVSSVSILSSSTQDFVDFNAGSRQILTNRYDLRFATSHSGLDYLALNGSGVDILDRGKIRIEADQSGVITRTVTEDLFNNISPIQVKDGPIRVVIEQQYAALSSTLKTTYVGYDALIVGTAELALAELPGVSVNHLRVSMDFNSNVAGSVYFNGNVPGGVSTDGVPDAGADTSLSNWFQLSHTTGRYFQITDAGPMGANPQFYYEDDSSTAVSDTGDGQSYSESGYYVTGGVNLVATSESVAYILPPANASIGEGNSNYSIVPLAVSGRMVDGTVGAASILRGFLPVILK
ncbi:MAG: hypothetical protein AAF629_34050 [Chloroflexota bacterium]